jgi:CHAD domain-containing protein
MLDFVFEQLSARVERVKATALATRVAPTEEAIHEFRVSIRRLTEAVRSLEHWVKAKPAEKLRERLRPVMKAAGEARNLDIARELLPSVAEALAPLRTEAAHRLIEELLLLDVDKLRPPCEPDPDVPAPRLMAAPILADLIPKYWEAGDNATDLHQFRLATKHLRYTIELFAPVYGRGAQTKLGVLKDIQSHLGKFHDCQAARELGAIKNDPQLQEWLSNRQEAQREKFQKTWQALRQQRNAWIRYFSRASFRGASAPLR